MTAPDVDALVARMNDAAQWQMQNMHVTVGVDADDLRALLAALREAREALETIATIHERHDDCSQVERIQQAYDMRCVARRALSGDPK